MVVAVLAMLAIGTRPLRGQVTPPPRKGGGRMLTFEELRALAEAVGFVGDAADIAAAIALAESSGDVRATNIVTAEQAADWNAAHPGQPRHGPERSFGLWQINTLAHPQYDEGRLLDGQYNAHAAFQVSSGGTNFKPWSTYNTGLYRKHMPTEPDPA